MITVLTVVHVVLTLALIGLVLIQKGKGADIGAAFGGGASNTVFGSQGSASFLTRATAVVATLFFVISLSLAYLASQSIHEASVTDSIGIDGVVDVPVVPESVTDMPPVVD